MPAVHIDVSYEGLARRLFELPEDLMMEDGLNAAVAETRKEIADSFFAGGRPAWKLTKDGRVPLNVTGALRRACSSEAEVTLNEESFDLEPSSSVKEVIPIVQNKRYNFFRLPQDALDRIFLAFEKGLMEG